MGLKVHKNTDPRRKARLTKKRRIRGRISGTPERPRLAVFKSARQIYAQLIDDVNGTTIAAVSTLKNGHKGKVYGGNIAAAKGIGKEIGEVAKTKGIETVVFDRSGYLYHGRVKALADSAREAGLKF
jgi:large subunit ribosomal protein L18